MAEAPLAAVGLLMPARAYPRHVTPDGSASSPVSSSSEQDFVVSPLALAATWAFIRAARRRKPATLIVGIAAMAVEFGLPAYDRFKRNRAVPTFLRVSRTPG